MKNVGYIILLLCGFGASLHGMGPVDKTMITRLGQSVTVGGLAWATPGVAAYFLPEGSRAQHIVPPLIKYGGYAASGILAANATGLSPKNAHKFAFIIPFAAAYKADALSDYIMKYAPEAINEDLKSVMSPVLKGSIIATGISLGVYLLATQTLDLTTQRDIKDKFEKLTKSINLLGYRMTGSTHEVEKAAASLKKITTSSSKQLIDLKLSFDENDQRLRMLDQSVLSLGKINTQSADQINGLKKTAESLIKNTASLELIKSQVSQELNHLKDALDKNIAQAHKEDNASLLESGKKIGRTIDTLYQACKDEDTNLEVLRERLASLMDAIQKKQEKL